MDSKKSLADREGCCDVEEAADTAATVGGATSSCSIGHRCVVVADTTPVVVTEARLVVPMEDGMGDGDGNGGNKNDDGDVDVEEGRGARSSLCSICDENERIERRIREKIARESVQATEAVRVTDDTPDDLTKANETKKQRRRLIALGLILAIVAFVAVVAAFVGGGGGDQNDDIPERKFPVPGTYVDVSVSICVTLLG